MPTPKKGESEKDYVARCVPYVMEKEGIKDSKQAAAKCYGLYRQSKKKKDWQEASVGYLKSLEKK